MARAPIEMMIDQASMRCAKCGAPAGSCGCWTACRCGWHFETGGACHNPAHAVEEAARKLAVDLAVRIDIHMKSLYPEAMRAASGGFRRTLLGTIEREAAGLLTIWSDAARERFR